VLPAVAVKVTEVPEQIIVADAPIETVGVRFGLTVIVMALDDAVVDAKQVPPVMVISQVTELPLVKVVLTYVFDDVFCTLVPPTLKLYITVPPPMLLAVAVNVTEVPEQIVSPGLAAIETVGF